MSAENSLDHELIIAGSGISGITSAIALRRAGIDDFVILEASKQPGGVWRDNVYPGVACDIPTVVYQHKDALNPNWSRFYARGDEIINYLKSIQKEYRLDRQTVYGTRVSCAEYDESRQIWRITLDDGEILHCRYFIKATGAFNSPKMPDISGLNEYRGEIFHTAEWPKDINLHGKRVAVIGTGASAIQLIPIVAKQAGQLRVYQRTPIWLLPKLEFDIPKPMRWALKNIPGAHKTYHKLCYEGMGYALDVLLANSGKHPRIHKALELSGRWNIRRQLKDKNLVRKFTPQYNLGCKRPSFSNEFYATFNRPNVQLNTDGIAELTADGILSEGHSKAEPFDVIILATGFNILDDASTSLPAFPVLGRNGLSLRDYWHHKAGFRAFRGASVPDFPNLFLNLGIPFASGTSWYETADIISAHIVACLGEAKARRCQEVEVKKTAVDAFMRYMEDLQRWTIHNTGSCTGSNTYYLDKHGKTPLYAAELPAAAWASATTNIEENYSFRRASRKAKRPLKAVS